MIAVIRASWQRFLARCSIGCARRIIIISAALDLLLMMYVPKRWRWAAGVFMVAKRPLVSAPMLAAIQHSAAEQTINDLRRLWPGDASTPQ